MMPFLCNLGRENCRVSLSCVTWNGRTPSVWGQLVLHSGRRTVRGFKFLWLFGRVGGPLFCSMLPGSSFPVSRLGVLGFSPIFPVTVCKLDDQGMSNVGLKSFIVSIYVNTICHTWSWWVQTSSLGRMSLCSSCTAVSYHIQTLPKRRQENLKLIFTSSFFVIGRLVRSLPLT